jgi:ribosomal protein S18 acetylase RimI-like enzyme
MTVHVRPMTKADLPAVAPMAGALVRLHHETDPRRFFLVPNIEEGYAAFFARELGNGDAFLFVAEKDGAIAGYTYATLEGRDWNLLLDAHGAIHDVFVDPRARGAGVAKALLNTVIGALEDRGAVNIVLSTMVSNMAAQRVFAKAGFRPTMIEMTRSSTRDS